MITELPTAGQKSGSGLGLTQTSGSRSASWLENRGQDLTKTRGRGRGQPRPRYNPSHCLWNELDIVGSRVCGRRAINAYIGQVVLPIYRRFTRWNLDHMFLLYEIPFFTILRAFSKTLFKRLIWISFIRILRQQTTEPISYGPTSYKTTSRRWSKNRTEKCVKWGSSTV